MLIDKKNYLLAFLIIILSGSCVNHKAMNDKMITHLDETSKRIYSKDNNFCPEAEYEYYNQLANDPSNPARQLQSIFILGYILMKLGKDEQACAVFENVYRQIPDLNAPGIEAFYRNYALSYLRLGERKNCITNHSTESCIVPIQGNGIHLDKTGSKKAIEIYEILLKRNPKDYESMWLMNLAYMTIGEYPSGVPKEWLVPGLDKDNSGYSINPFEDVAQNLGISLRDMAGGEIIDDFNNDGYLDIITSDWNIHRKMHYFQNDTQGGFIDLSEKSDLARFSGGLNIVQTDYNNDGFLDVFVFRGGWMGPFGRQINSLLRNNGDDTFTDVTFESGITSEYPTQTGVWRDFNKDGWLDLYIGNESTNETGQIPSELYLNNQDGTFKEVGSISGSRITAMVKGVTSADYNNDGREDIFISTCGGAKILLQNIATKNGIPMFIKSTATAGLEDNFKKTFPTWFWDYNNDGWEDLFVCGYEFGESVGHSAATEALNIPNQAGVMYLYKNNKDGTFTNESKTANLNKTVFAMGANFGDIDNDGFLDMYLGTGNPDYGALTPNRLFRNMGDGSFADVTVAGRVGNLQKGHAVALTDLDNDGDQDIYIKMGGAYIGDVFNTSLYLNPGQNNNHWINIQLIGTETNRAAIGSRLKFSFRDQGVLRNVYSTVNSGGSFGSTSLRREIGLGQAEIIDELEITWQKTGKKQLFKNIKPNQFLIITEGNNEIKTKHLKSFDFKKANLKGQMCKPNPA